jgi:hypothetical protein
MYCFGSRSDNVAFGLPRGVPTGKRRPVALDEVSDLCLSEIPYLYPGLLPRHSLLHGLFADMEGLDDAGIDGSHRRNDAEMLACGQVAAADFTAYNNAFADALEKCDDSGRPYNFFFSLSWGCFSDQRSDIIGQSIYEIIETDLDAPLPDYFFEPGDHPDLEPDDQSAGGFRKQDVGAGDGPHSAADDLYIRNPGEHRCHSFDAPDGVALEDYLEPWVLLAGLDMGLRFHKFSVAIQALSSGLLEDNRLTYSMI